MCVVFQGQEIKNSFLLYTYQYSEFDTADITECNPTFRITTLWYSESISPLSETDDVVNKKWPVTIPNLGLDRHGMSTCVTSERNLGQSWLK